MEDSDEFKWAVKVVIKRQMRDLMEQLRERGEEIAILTVNLDDNSCSHFGSPSGEWFVSEQKNLAQNFLKFCKKEKRGGRNADSAASSHTGFDTFSTPRSSTFKQRTAQSAGAPILTVTVPKQLAGDITEEELAALVGRVVASQLAVQEKGDGSSGGTKFDLLVEAANQSKSKEGTGSVLSTPSTRSTRKRKFTQKYKEGMSTLKKGKKSEEEDTGSDYETGHDENAIINILAELSTPILKRVKVKTSEEVPVSIEKTVLMSSDNLESLAVLLIQELDEMAGGLLTKEKLIQVTVCLEEENADTKVTVEVEGVGFDKVKNEDMDDSDMEYLDLDAQAEDEEENSFMDETDPDFDPNVISTVKTPKLAAGIKAGSKDFPNSLPNSGLKRKKKSKKPLSETMPTPCEHCGVHLAGKSNLKSHIRRVHLKQKDKKCTICGKGFWSGTARESHMLSVHTRRCEACQEYVVESVPWNSGMDMRMKRDVICTCGAIVSIYSTFGRKRQYLRDDEPDEDGNLPEPESRRKSNTGTKYACGTCGKLFMKKSNCERHSRAHTDYKGIECELCGSQFSYESSLKKHLQTEHGITKHVCEICGKNYSNETALKVHYVKYHAQENLTIGENVVMIVKEKGNDTADLEQQMEEIMEGEDEGEEEQHNGQITQLGEGTSLVVSESGQVVVTRGEGGQMTLTTEEGHPVGDSEAARIVQQVIHDGQVVAQEGNMSIIIKQLPVDEME
ncbi:myoneurin-like isoform X2 [Mercenaria mercenaria]|uniref:myoneurin-like isoform X2 n=1 Tax=Mercenaria mercenaria TaxID=6596 RepID=UPI00234F4CAF|nr:myoneurin-like isoform X2 [Mercenaria mercenaria]